MIEFFIGLVIAGLAGYIASRVLGTDANQPWWQDVLFGLIGGAVGNRILSLFFNESGLIQLIGSIGGAILVLWIWISFIRPRLKG